MMMMSLHRRSLQFALRRRGPCFTRYLSSTKKKSLKDNYGLTFQVTRLQYDQGKIETVNLSTSELLRSASLFARDLITLNLTSRQERQRGATKQVVRRPVSAIMPRESLIVLSFGHIRAVAGLDYVVLLDAHNPAVQDFAKELSEVYRSGDTEGEPNELVFLEQVLRDTVDSFNRRLRLYEPIVESFLDKVAYEVYSETTGVHQLVPIKDSLQSFQIVVKQHLDCVTDLLNDDAEMLALLLTEQAEATKLGEKVAFARHEHVELLLESYARQFGNILSEIMFLLSRLQSKQEFVTLALAVYRNRMVRMNVHLGIAGLSLGLGTTVAGFYGMNLINGMESSPTAFTTVVMMSGMGGMLIAFSCLNYMSGRAMRQRASHRIEEIETLTSALSDMGALDYTVKTAIEQGISMDKDQFRQILQLSRQTKRVSSEEVDLLFDIFDKVKDGQLQGEDFRKEDGYNNKPTKTTT